VSPIKVPKSKFLLTAVDATIEQAYVVEYYPDVNTNDVKLEGDD
jgi:hypothetical protein